MDSGGMRESGVVDDLLRFRSNARSVNKLSLKFLKFTLSSLLFDPRYDNSFDRLDISSLLHGCLHFSDFFRFQ